MLKTIPLTLLLTLCLSACQNNNKAIHDQPLPTCTTQKEIKAQFRKQVYVVGELYIPGPRERRGWTNVKLKDGSTVLLAFSKIPVKKKYNKLKVRTKGLALKMIPYSLTGG